MVIVGKETAINIKFSNLFFYVMLTTFQFFLDWFPWMK